MVGKTIFACVAMLLIQFPIAGNALSGACEEAMARYQEQSNKNKARRDDRSQLRKALLEREGVGQSYYDQGCADAKEHLADFDVVIKFRDVVAEACKATHEFSCDTACVRENREVLKKVADTQCNMAEERRKR